MRLLKTGIPESERRMKMITRNMKQKPTWEDLKDSIASAIQHIAVLRRECITLDIPRETVDEFIALTARSDFSKFENMSEGQLIVFMLNEIMMNAPQEIMNEFIDDLRGEQDA